MIFTYIFRLSCFFFWYFSCDLSFFFLFLLFFSLMFPFSIVVLFLPFFFDFHLFNWCFPVIFLLFCFLLIIMFFIVPFLYSIFFSYIFTFYRFYYFFLLLLMFCLCPLSPYFPFPYSCIHIFLHFPLFSLSSGQTKKNIDRLQVIFQRPSLISLSVYIINSTTSPSTYLFMILFPSLINHIGVCAELFGYNHLLCPYVPFLTLY